MGTFWVPLKLRQVASSLFSELGETIEKFNRGDLFRTEIDSTDTDLEPAARDALRPTPYG